MQCCGSWIGAFFTPVSAMGKKSRSGNLFDPGSGIRDKHPRSATVIKCHFISVISINSYYRASSLIIFLIYTIYEISIILPREIRNCKVLLR